jgi:hypothetical protein
VFRLNEVMDDIKWQVSKYHTDKILSGEGLQDDPEWVVKFEELLEAHRD